MINYIVCLVLFLLNSVYCKRTISEKGYNVSNWWSPLPTAEKQVQRLSNQREEAMEMFGPGPGVDLNVTLLPIVEFHQSNQACYADLGCITRFSFADPLLWPINLLPESRTKINTHFTLYTRENSNPQVKIIFDFTEECLLFIFITASSSHICR